MYQRLAPFWIPIRTLLLAALIGAGAGSASALFLVLLAYTNDTWHAYPALIWGLPLVGFVIAAVYRGYGAGVASGMNLLIDAVYHPTTHRVPLRMVPLVLGSTLLTHLCGGSAGREGTAVQMAGGLTAALLRWCRIEAREARILLMAGISAGFSSVFGTPLAGTIFGMEVLGGDTVRTRAALPCLVAALVGDATVRWFGVDHGQYRVDRIPAVSLSLVGWSMVAGMVFAGIAVLYILLTQFIAAKSTLLIADPRWRSAWGGVILIWMTYAVGTPAYNGLSLALLEDAFSPTGVPSMAFVYKLLFTAVTLGLGFKGGEVTPLFVIGATAGATMGRAVGLPMDMMAALGFVTVFGAAAKTPVACFVLGLELFGTTILVPLSIAVFLACAMVGTRGIYHAQRVGAFDQELDTAQQRPRLHERTQGGRDSERR